MIHARSGRLTSRTPSQDIELTARDSRPSGEASDDELDPDSDRALLNRHRDRPGHDARHRFEPTIISAVWAYVKLKMSQSPLLGYAKASRQPSYTHLGLDGGDGRGRRRQAGGASSSTGGQRHGSRDVSPLSLESKRSNAKAYREPDGPVDDENPPDNSPYPQVRASVSPTDNITLSINTPRMWILSLLFAIVGSALNLFFSLRYPAVTIQPIIALILVHPLGKLWDMVFKRDDDPDVVFEHGQRTTPLDDDGEKASAGRRLRLWLAQGSWNEKEHACVYVSSNVSFGFAFATDVIVEQTKFYRQDLGVLYQLLLTISTQILGYSFAGLTRRYLVQPPSMIWPGLLASTAMFSTFHKSENKICNGWKITRFKLFSVVWLGAFLWYFFPGLLAPALSYFNVLTWFSPNNVVVANLFGVTSGLGLFPVTFDWAQIAYTGSPLLVPFWAAVNVVGGLALCMWIIAPILYYRNTLYSAFLPILSSSVFDNTAKEYDVQRILTPDFLFDETAYQRYSPIYLPMTYFVSYAVQFASLTALVTHTICWHGADIWAQTKKSFVRPTTGKSGDYSSPGNGVTDSSTRIDTAMGETSFEYSMTGEDVHNRLMRRYEDAPASWYAGVGIAMFIVAIFICVVYPVHLPWYGLVLALSITTVLFLPVAIIMAITNIHQSLYLICQLICGYVFPGRAVANMIFVTYCYISSTQGIKFAGDLKLGHYMKIPPRILFAVQMVATFISSIVQVGVLNWMFVNVRGICTPEAINGFTCPIARVHYNGSILWGTVGPARFFDSGALYRKLVWAFPLGFILPILFWLLARSRPKSFLRKINLPIVFGSLSWIPPATGLNFSVWFVICFIFNYVVRRRASAWWEKYTMVMSAALDSGLAFAVVVVFFVFVYPGFMENFKWWGTEIYKQGCDWKACSFLPIPDKGYFGPP